MPISTICRRGGAICSTRPRRRFTNRRSWPRSRIRTEMTAEADYAALRSFGLALPETTEDHPWGHCAIKVRGKTFLWLDKSDGTLSLTVKLPVSRDFALIFDF